MRTMKIYIPALLTAGACLLSGCKPGMPETVFKATIKVVDKDTGKPVPGALVLVGARISVEPEFEPPYDVSMAGNRGFTNNKGEAEFKVVKGLYEGNKPKDALWRVLEDRKPKVGRKILGVESGSILVFAPGYGLFHQPFGVADNPKFTEYLAKRNESSEEFSGWFPRGYQAEDYDYKAVLVKAEELKNNREITISVGKVAREGADHRFVSFQPIMLGYTDITTSRESGTTRDEKLDIYAFFMSQLEYAVRVSSDPAYREWLNEYNDTGLLKEFMARQLNGEENHERYIHEWLTRKALENLAEEYKEIKEYAQVIQEGVKDEDKGLRSLNHFYNPDEPEQRISGISENALKWGAIGYPDNPDNEWDLEDAKTYYRNGDKVKAYKALGHVLHLLEDLSSPMHTRLISHVSGPESRFETYFDGMFKKNANSLPPEYWQTAETIKLATDIKQLFEDTAKLTFGSFAQDGRTVNFNDYYAPNKFIKNPDNQTLELMGKYLFPKMIMTSAALMVGFYHTLHPNLSAQKPAETSTDAGAAGNEGKNKTIQEKAAIGNEYETFKFVSTRTFVSENKKFIITVKYEGYGGAGKAAYLIQNDKGDTLGSFIAEMPPYYKVYVSNAGNRLLSFGGGWAEEAYINRMNIYDFSGNIIKDYKSDKPLLNRVVVALSNSGDIFALGTLCDYEKYLNKNIIAPQRTLVLFNFTTGSIVKQIPLAHALRIISIAISNNMNWVIATYYTDYIESTAALIDTDGNTEWKTSSKGSLSVKSISSDGKHFQIEDNNGKGRKTVFKYKNDRGKVQQQQ